MKIICCQLDIVWENKSANHDKVRAMLDKAQPPKGALLLLPEMFATGFTMNVASATETNSSETHDFLAEMAAKYGVYMLGGVVTSGPAGKGRNEAVVFNPDGREVVRYQKIHPFTRGGESQHYQAGSTPVFFSWAGFTVCPFICYDLRFPEIFRAAVRRGANLFTVIADWPVARVHHWVTLLQARAIENLAYIAATNQCGKDPKYVYPGRSMIVDPHGKILAEAGEEPAVISADVDVKVAIDWRKDFPALADIHEEFVRT